MSPNNASQKPYTEQPWKRSMFDPETIVTEARPNIHLVKIETTGLGKQVDDIANLVAAAPELYAVAQVMVLNPKIRQFLLAMDPKALEQAERAIAKAKGE